MPIYHSARRPDALVNALLSGKLSFNFYCSGSSIYAVRYGNPLVAPLASIRHSVRSWHEQCLSLETGRCLTYTTIQCDRTYIQTLETLKISPSYFLLPREDRGKSSTRCSDVIHLIAFPASYPASRFGIGTPRLQHPLQGTEILWRGECPLPYTMSGAMSVGLSFPTSYRTLKSSQLMAGVLTTEPNSSG